MKLTPQQQATIELLENQGKLTPSAVVEEAQRDGSPLKPLFQWDLQSAAMEHWLDTARAVIRCVRVVVTTTHYSIDVVRYIPDPNKNKPQGYTSILSVTTDEERMQVMLAEAERSLGLLRRANDIALALGNEGIGHIISELERWKGEVRGDPQPTPIRPLDPPDDDAGAERTDTSA